MAVLPGFGSVEVKRGEPQTLVINDEGLKAFLYDSRAFQIYLQNRKRPLRLDPAEVKAAQMREFIRLYRLAFGSGDSLPKFPPKEDLPSGVNKEKLDYYFTHNCPIGRKVTPYQCRYVVAKNAFPSERFVYTVFIDDYRQFETAQLMLIEPLINNYHPEGLLGFRLGMAVCSDDRLLTAFSENRLRLCAWSVGSKLRFELEQFDPELIRQTAIHLAHSIVLGYGIDLTSQTLKGAEWNRQQQVLATATNFFGKLISPAEVMEKAKLEFSVATDLLHKLEGSYGSSRWHRMEAVSPKRRRNKRTLRPVRFEID